MEGIWDLRSCVAQCCQPQGDGQEDVSARQFRGGEVLNVAPGQDVPDFSRAKLDAISLRQAREGWKDKAAICITSIKEGKPHTITFANLAFLQMMRMKKKDVIRQSIEICFGKATDKAMSAKLLRHLSTGTIGNNMTMIIYPYPPEGLNHATRKWVTADSHPLKDWVGAHAFNKIRFEVGTPVRQDIVWYWERKNEFANFNEIAAFEEATQKAEKFGGGINRAQRHLQSNQYTVQSNQGWQDQDPNVYVSGPTSMTVRSPSGQKTMQSRPTSKVKPRQHISQELDPGALPDGVLRSIVRSPFLLDQDTARLASSFQFNKTRVERERLEQAFFAKPDPKLLANMRKLKESIQKVDGNFVSAGANLRALRQEVIEADLAAKGNAAEDQQSPAKSG